MAAVRSHKLCEDCAKRKACEFIPTRGMLIRCLDRQAVGSGRQALSVASAGGDEFVPAQER